MAVAWLRTLAAFRAVEDNPCQQVFRKIFKAMHFAGSGKKRITGTKLHALTFDKKPTASSRHDIKLVTRVRLLQVRALGRVDLDRQGAMTEKFGIKFAVTRWDGV